MKYIINDVELIEEVVNQGILNTTIPARHKVWISVLVFNDLNPCCKKAVTEADPPWLEIGELSWELLEKAGLQRLTDGKISFSDWVHISETQKSSGILITKQKAVTRQAIKTGVKVSNVNKLLKWIKPLNSKPKPVKIKKAIRLFNDRKVSDLRAKQTNKNR